MTPNSMIGKTIPCGVGGRGCSCCYPPPGKQRKADKRSKKRSERSNWKKEVARML